MKLARVEKNEAGEPVSVFLLARQERDCLLDALRVYPGLSVYAQPISRTGAATPEAQKLLDEAARELRAARSRKLDEFLSGSPRLTRELSGRYRLALNGEDYEWLLQVLNEIRVGCWALLGSPDLDKIPTQGLTPEQLRLRAAMDVSGYFQMELLQR
jgi:hypothetical protein